MRWPIVVQGREVDEEKMRWLTGWIGEHAHWSRRRLAGELCVPWDWRDGSGRPKDLHDRWLDGTPTGGGLGRAAGC